MRETGDTEAAERLIGGVIRKARNGCYSERAILRYEMRGNVRSSLEYIGSFDGGKLQLGLLLDDEIKKTNENMKFGPAFYLKSSTSLNSSEARAEFDPLDTTKASEPEGRNYMEDLNGLNFIVFDHETKKIIDTATFDTHAGLERTSDLPLDER